MKLEHIDTANIAEHWVCPIIYGDTTGLSDEEERELEQWMKQNPAEVYEFGNERVLTEDDISGLLADCVECKLWARIDRVIFRTYKKNPKDVFALLPDQPQDPETILGYDSRNQHWETIPQDMIRMSRPCHNPEEYANLKHELEGRGYHLKVVKRMPRK